MTRTTRPSFVTRSDVMAPHAMAATSHPLATQAALDVLRRGGSAVDGAIAANAVLCLGEPTGAGLGGDLFAIVWDAASERLHGLNASGRAPQALRREHFLAMGLEAIPPTGPLPVTVPGCVDGWHELHARFGRSPWADLFAAAIDYAEEGIPITQVIAGDWARGAARLRDQPGFADVFLREGRAPRPGERFRNGQLAATLRVIASLGRDAFYRGPIAKTIDAFCRREGCFLRADDLAAHESEWVEPVSTTYRGAEVWELPPNGQGIAVLQMLNLLEPYDLGAMGFGSADHLHHLIEAKKIAYEDRARYYADPAFADVPVDAMISKAYAAERRRLLDPGQAATALGPGDPRLSGGDTVYLTVADEARNLVSLIQSNFRGFGSGLCPDPLGFCLQDRGELFALDADHPNAYAPGKRPFHTIIPGFVTRNGFPWLSFGVMGGDMQPQGHVQILTNLLDFGMGLQEAGDAPRVYHGGSSAPTGTAGTGGGFVALEPGFAPEVAAELVRRGHCLISVEGVYGGYQAIRYGEGEGVWVGASESRKDGHAAGW